LPKQAFELAKILELDAVAEGSCRNMIASSKVRRDAEPWARSRKRASARRNRSVSTNRSIRAASRSDARHTLALLLRPSSSLVT